MKQDIHPKYFEKAEIRCACGNVIEVGSTKESMKVDTCSKCHSFFTGAKQSLSSKGRVAMFTEKYLNK
ncbi:MAG: 50S ribosomal protein L31 [Clostridia bacterium]|nr:50S ribosomal protein L31 [Clostridia bacterium]